jgi:hypothetical protein
MGALGALWRESRSEPGYRIVLISGKKSVFLHLTWPFSLFIDNIRCGCARFKGAGHTFQEHKKNRKMIDNSMRKLFFVWDLRIFLANTCDFNWKIIECECITVQKPLEIIGYLHFSWFFQGLTLKLNFLIELSIIFRFFLCSWKVCPAPLKRAQPHLILSMKSEKGQVKCKKTLFFPDISTILYPGSDLDSRHNAPNAPITKLYPNILATMHLTSPTRPNFTQIYSPNFTYLI